MTTATHNGTPYRVIYTACGDLWARDIIAAATRPRMKPTKYPHITKTGTVHIKTPAGLMCGRTTATEPHNELVSVNDLCGGCLRALCAVWEPQAVPVLEPVPF